MARSKRQQEIQMYVLLSVMMTFFSVMLLAIFYIARPDEFQRAYFTVRQAEFLSFWDDLFPTARKAIYDAQYGYFSLRTLVVTSLPTALLAGVGILTLGLVAFNKVSTEHLDSYITHKEPPTMRTILSRFALFKPAVRFVLDYSVHPLSSMRGAGRLPYNPLQFLEQHQLIRRIGTPDEWDNADVNPDYPEPLPFLFLDIDTERTNALLAATFGARNPFLGLSSLSDIKMVRQAVDKLPWHIVLVVAPAMARIHHSIFYEEKAYVSAVLDLHKFPDEIWADLNELKRKEGGRLRLGFDDEKHRASENSLWLEEGAGKRKRRKGKSQAHDLITLAEYLAEPVKEGGSQVPRAETLPSVKKARKLLFEVLTQHLMEDRKAYPVAVDHQGRFVFKDRPPVDAAERAFLDRVYERLMKAADECNRIVRANAFCFGLLGSAVERTRQMGVFHPAPYRWMRFVERDHWRFFLDRGKPISSVDAMGMWEHFEAEKAIESPVYDPFLRRSANDLKRQAARFVTKDFVRHFNAMNSVDDAGDQVSISSLLDEIDRANEQRADAGADLEETLRVDLDDFDPQQVFDAPEKPLSLKTRSERYFKWRKT